mgnify:CR=1 FL=1
MADKSSFYRERAKALEKRLEREQEWETYFPGITNREYATYADACACGMARRLDEIEAALDDGNISTFADYLRDFSKDTQFVVVTHRKGTMERCDGLYGVAMESPAMTAARCW